MIFTSTIQTDEQLREKTEQILIEILNDSPAFLDVREYSHLAECQAISEQIKDFDHLLVLGIGGSALGTQSVIQALKKEDKVTVLDNIDPEYIEDELKKIDWDKTCVNVISKSGGTLEPMTQFAIIEKILKNKYDNYKDRIICTTGEGSLLDNHAKENGYKTLPVPHGIGGRFSVMTPVGIFPLMFAGVNAEELIKGAENIKQEEIINFTSSQYKAYKEDNLSICALMTYNRKLTGLLDWYRQLLAESIGKNKDTGITPVMTFGSTDQHSQIQLFNDGPEDKLILFLSTSFKESNEKLKVLGLKNPTTISDAHYALYEGTKKGLEKHNRPLSEFMLNTVNEEEIGNFFMTCMMQISVLAKLLDVNAYDQPGVEEGKIQAKKILGEN